MGKVQKSNISKKIDIYDLDGCFRPCCIAECPKELWKMNTSHGDFINQRGKVLVTKVIAWQWLFVV